ncbi:MAG: sensor histidine kinase [Oscillospiraceae bacterium]
MFMGYLKAHVKSIIVWLTMIAVFAAVFGLFGLPCEAVLYGGAVSGFFGLIFFIIDYMAFCRRKKALEKAAGEITLTLDSLPAPRSGIEAEYDELVRQLFCELKNTENETAARLSDMTEYYTRWVHQIKTPIAAADLILQSTCCPEKAELTEDLRRIEQYAEMVLCYLRLDSDSTDFVIKEYDLDGMIRQAVRKFSSQFIRRKLKLIYSPVEKTVLTDEKWLLFVIEQVISNAVKYTPSGEVEIYCENELTLCIRDTGIGVAPEDIPRIFEKGYTGCNGRLDKKASGIGLYLCRRICGKLGHSISAESSANGTVIRIDLSRRALETE